MAESNLVCCNPSDQPSFSSQVLFAPSLFIMLLIFAADYSQVDNTNPTHSYTDETEKLLYLLVVTLGNSRNPAKQFTGFSDATNDWYVIKRGSNGQLICLPTFQGIKPFNDPHNALCHVTSQVIGSRIYLIGGCRVNAGSHPNHHIPDPGSSKIRCLDTCNLSKGWRTCATLPFDVCATNSTVLNDHCLYFFGGNRFFKPHSKPQEPWGYTLNLYDDHDNKKETQQGTKIDPPGSSTYSPFVSSFSQNALVVYAEQDSTLYQLDCTNNTWTVLQKDLPYKVPRCGGCYAIYDGILYIYDPLDYRLISYDIRNKKELDVVDLPATFSFGGVKSFNLIVLAKNKFCLIWDEAGMSVNYINIFYTGFSISYIDGKPTVVPDEFEAFHVPGYELHNVVPVTSYKDAVADSPSCSKGFGTEATCNLSRSLE